MKSVEIKGGEELSDFTVEIDILTECQHPNIVRILEAFYTSNTLYVSLGQTSCLLLPSASHTESVVIAVVFLL